jgi:restriction system protein
MASSVTIPPVSGLYWPTVTTLRDIGGSGTKDEIVQAVIERMAFVSLISFSVFFQCKRYKGSVRASEVRDFRGALQGRGDKGLLITTGTFTAEALKESTRDGAPPIDLVDGDRLCDLLKEYGLGVTRELVQVERVRVNPRFFETI